MNCIVKKDEKVRSYKIADHDKTERIFLCLNLLLACGFVTVALKNTHGHVRLFFKSFKKNTKNTTYNISLRKNTHFLTSLVVGVFYVV